MSKDHSRSRGKGKRLGYRTPSAFRADPRRISDRDMGNSKNRKA